jgi:hypothetical protein
MARSVMQKKKGGPARAALRSEYRTTRAVNLKFLSVSRRVHRWNFKFINRTRIIKLLVLLMFPKFA